MLAQDSGYDGFLIIIFKFIIIIYCIIYKITSSERDGYYHNNEQINRAMIGYPALINNFKCLF